jgi:hypothetical protein
MTLSGGERIPDIDECSRRCHKSLLESNVRAVSGGFKLMESGDSTVLLTVRLPANHALRRVRGVLRNRRLRMTARSRRVLMGLALIAVVTTCALGRRQEAFAADATRIPSIGCKTFEAFSDRWSKETIGKKSVHIARSFAAELSDYVSGGENEAFAPRNWTCRSWAGIGSVMIIVPRSTRLPNESKYHMTAGPAVATESVSGETSGRDLVAEYASWYFPRVAKDYIRAIVKFDREEPDSAQVGPNPYPHDEVTYLTPMLVRVVTPPNTYGVGTDGPLSVGHDEVISFVKLVLKPDPGMVIISIRLPRSMHSLERVLAHMNSESLRH